MEYQFRPLATWPGPRNRPVRSQFKAGWSATVDLLERELRHLRARQIVLQCDVTADQIRLDGMLRADARPQSPAIILSFESRHGPLSYPCDRYTNWQHNVRAIALSLEALRAVDRHGVTRRAEQYQGWQRLPPPAAAGNADPQMSVEEAAAWLSKTGGGSANEILRNHDIMRASYLRAAQATHPDAGGDAADFRRVAAAKQVLAQHFAI